MVIKLDLEKVYDKLEWSFIRNVLMWFDFPKECVRVIMKCISSPKVNVLFNGGKLDSIEISKGIR